MWYCFSLRGSAFWIERKICGAKLGMPLKLIVSPSVMVSPILKVPVSWIPTMSPGQASLMISLSWAMKAVGLAVLKGLPLRT